VGITLGLVLGDQLSESPAVCQDLGCSAPILLIEAPEEASHVKSHKARTVLFLSAMRHARERWQSQGYNVYYIRTDEPGFGDEPTLAGRLLRFLQVRKAQWPEVTLRFQRPGDWRLQQSLQKALADQPGLTVVEEEDPHFYCSPKSFADWAKGKRQLRMELFYREQRRRHGVLLQPDGEPEAGQWNFDAQNRKPFGKKGPGEPPAPLRIEPDTTTREAMDDVERWYPDHPGDLQAFFWPVTPEQARLAWRQFLEQRLDDFGPTQDAMWTGLSIGWHSAIGSSLNLHMLDPRELVADVEKAYREGRVRLESAEGFIRQVLGWREYMRGIYWLEMPGLLNANELKAKRPLPDWFWTGQTHMNCQRQVVEQTLELGYAHHIQRLMVTGLFGLLAEIDPKEVSDWFLAVYVDAVHWVEHPNVMAMALYATGPRFTSKPYLASGAYIQRMSNYCQGCCYKPSQRLGEQACPVTQFFWSFIGRHEELLKKNPRTSMMVKNWQRMEPEERDTLLRQAETRLGALSSL
jgi:deoxyribodipyrimidine photolyase-related protein